MLPNWYLEYKKLIDDSIINYLEGYFKSEENVGFKNFRDCIIYSCKGGKRIRSILALEFFSKFNNNEIEINKLTINDNIIKFCVAIELLHSYSLIHDDLPAMDNDMYRRGELTTWKKYGETNAILAGDLLNSLAFELLSEIGNIKIIKLFGKSVNLSGMVGGQVLDIYFEKNTKELTLENLLEIHNKKTGALINFSIIGAIILSGYNGNIKNYYKFGQKIGLAFQIKDDLLEIEGKFEEIGKKRDIKEQKGFVYFIGTEKTKNYLQELIIDCKEIIKNLNSKKLNFLIDYIGNRKK